LKSAHARRCLSSISFLAHSDCSLSIQWYHMKSGDGDCNS
jgi:hypothetical protein